MIRTNRFGIIVGFTILFLVSSLLCVADSGDMQKANGMLEIVEGAITNVNNTLTEIESEGVEVSELVMSLYQEALSLSKEATILAQDEEYIQSCSKSQEALSRFEELLTILTGVVQNTPSELEELVSRILILKSEINRVFEFLERLKNQASTAQIYGYNTTTLDIIIYEIEVLLNTAWEMLEELDIDNASAIMVEVGSLLNEAQFIYKSFRTDVKTVKTEEFLMVTEERFLFLKKDVTELSQDLPEFERNITILALTEAEYRLQRARTYIEKTQLNATILELLEYQEAIKESLKYVQISADELEERG